MCHRNIRQRLWVVVVARKGLSVEVISEQRLSEAKQGCLGIWESHAGRGDAKCKGPETAMCVEWTTHGADEAGECQARLWLEGQKSQVGGLFSHAGA